jgi:hypothetical protein
LKQKHVWIRHTFLFRSGEYKSSGLCANDVFVTGTHSPVNMASLTVQMPPSTSTASQHKGPGRLMSNTSPGTRRLLLSCFAVELRNTVTSHSDCTLARNVLFCYGSKRRKQLIRNGDSVVMQAIWLPFAFRTHAMKWKGWRRRARRARTGSTVERARRI